MKILGIHLHKGACRYAVLEGSRSNPVLLATCRLVTPDPAQVPALMDWYDTRFRQLIADHRPGHIAYRLTLDPTKDQLFYAEFPLGVLSLIAHQDGTPLSCYGPRSFTPSKLGLPRGTNLDDHCDATFGKHPPYWDTNQKYAVQVAWFELPK
jgi:hypothetical protein